MYAVAEKQSISKTVASKQWSNRNQVLPLSHVVVRGYANNEIRVMRRSASPVAKKYGDKAAERRATAVGRKVALVAVLGEELRKADAITARKIGIVVADGYAKRCHGGVVHREPRYFAGLEELGRIKPIGQYWQNGIWLVAEYAVADIRLLLTQLRRQEITLAVDKALAVGVLPNSTNGTPSPLDFAHEFQDRSLSSAKPRQQATFTPYARHCVLEAGAVIEKHWENHAVFATFTIPGSTPQALETVAKWSSWLMNRLYQIVRDECDRQNIEVGWFYCWELQKRGALHPHICLSAHPEQMTKRQLLTLAQQLEVAWFDLLAELRDRTGVDCFERARGGTWRYSPQHWQSKIEIVKKSVAAYLSKYASKEAQNRHKSAVTKLQRKEQLHTPKRWWGCSKTIRELIKMWRFEYVIPIANIDDPDFNKMLSEVIQGKYCMTECMTPVNRALGYRFEIFSGNRKILKGEQEIYWYNPEIFAEIHAQVKELKPVLREIAEGSSARRLEKEERMMGYHPLTLTISDYGRFISWLEWNECQSLDYWWKTLMIEEEEYRFMEKDWRSYLGMVLEVSAMQSEALPSAREKQQQEYDILFPYQVSKKRVTDKEWDRVWEQSVVEEMEYYRGALWVE